jgi:hypothetical protein
LEDGIERIVWFHNKNLMNRENQLTVEEAAELLSLMLMYYSGWWRKTEALVEAVKRGLRPPLEP